MSEWETLAPQRRTSDGWETVPGGAVTGVRKEPPARLLPEGVGAIGSATALGGAMGAMAPEILTGISGALRQIPQGARIAPFFDTAAIVTKAAGRPASTISGAIGGFTSETSGQAAESMGASPLLAESARLAGGAVPALTAESGRFLLDIFKKKLPTSLEASAAKKLAIEVLEKFGRDPKSLSEQEKAFINEQIALIRGGPATQEPQKQVYSLLDTAAKEKVAASSVEAGNILRNAQTAINQDFTSAMNGPVAYVRTAANRIGARGEDALATAQLQRLNVGRDADLSDIGTALRETIVGRNQAALAKRKEIFSADQAERDAFVAAKENTGTFLESIPEYQNLLTDLRNKLLIGRKAQEQTTAPVTESGVLKAYQNIYDAVTKRRVQVGTNEEGNPIYKEFPTSFAALDDVRRRLGTVFSGQPAEGYEAIGESIARRYYAQISDIQKKFGGPAQERLLKNYADATEGLEMFGSRSGRRATAVDRYDDTKFQTDQSLIPSQFFKSKQGVDDLIELTGNRNAVVTAAKDFATNELRDKNAQQVAKWMTDRREMLSALPEVRKAVIDYQNILIHGERTARAAELAQKRLAQHESDTIRNAERRGAASASEAERLANQATSTGEREARTLTGNAYPAERVRQLIESGDRRQWELAAPAILGAPGGKQALAESVRQVVAEKAETTTRGLSIYFNRNIRPALEATNGMTKAELDQISGRLSAIENMNIPEPQKLGIAKRVLLQGIGGYASSLGARGGAESYSSLVDLIPR